MGGQFLCSLAPQGRPSPLAASVALHSSKSLGHVTCDSVNVSVTSRRILHGRRTGDSLAQVTLSDMTVLSWQLLLTAASPSRWAYSTSFMLT